MVLEGMWREYGRVCGMLCRLGIDVHVRVGMRVVRIVMGVRMAKRARIVKRITGTQRM